MLTSLITFWLLYVAAMVSPGAIVLLVSQMAASDCGRSARFAGLGISVGVGLWATCAVLGVHVVFQAFPGLRPMLQIAGGLYLLYVASRLWRSRGGELSVRTNPISRFAAFRLGFFTYIANPEAALFFCSIFAASFPAQPSVLLQVTAVAIVVGSSLCWFSLLAYLFSRERIRATYSSIRQVANHVASIAMGTLGLSLLVALIHEMRA
jgi:threonine efflux protein